MVAIGPRGFNWLLTGNYTFYFWCAFGFLPITRGFLRHFPLGGAALELATVMASDVGIFEDRCIDMEYLSRI